MNVGWHYSDEVNIHLRNNSQTRPISQTSNTANRTNATPRNLLSAFNKVRSINAEATDILEHLKESLDPLMLNENDYLKFASTLKNMHAHNDLTTDNLTNALASLVTHSPAKAKQEFLSECHKILNPTVRLPSSRL